MSAILRLDVITMLWRSLTPNIRGMNPERLKIKRWFKGQFSENFRNIKGCWTLNVFQLSLITDTECILLWMNFPSKGRKMFVYFSNLLKTFGEFFFVKGRLSCESAICINKCKQTFPRKCQFQEKGLSFSNGGSTYNEPRPF